MINNTENPKLKEILIYNESINYPILKIYELKENYGKNKEYFNDRRLNEFIKHAFTFYDINKNGEIDLNYIRPCIYSLGICPSESQLKEIVDELEKNIRREKLKKRFTGLAPKKEKILLNDFIEILKPVIVSGKCYPKNTSILKKAFETIAVYLKKSTSEICWKDLENLLNTTENILTSKESDHLKINIQNNESIIDYSKYLNNLDECMEIMENFN